VVRRQLDGQAHQEVSQWHWVTTLLVFWLPAQICLTVFCAFFRRHLRPVAQAAMSMLHMARLVQAELYLSQTHAPP